MSFKKYGAKFLKGLRNSRVNSAFNTEAVRLFFQSLDCPRALTCWLLFSNGEHDQLAKLEFDPLWYESIKDVRDAYAATKFLSKSADLSVDYDLDEVALQKFEKFELLCKQTNYRFKDLSRHPLYNGVAVRLHSAVVRKIEKILGEFDPVEWSNLPSWGPGASTLIKRRDSSSPNKFQYETGITRDLFALLSGSWADPLKSGENFSLNFGDMLGETYPLWHKHLLEIGFPKFQVGNKVVTVPKDATANRVIAIEPGINIWFQLALGKMISSRLLRVGIDLTDQGRNQALAKRGSEMGRLATVDLSSASDSIATEVVRELIPPRWFSVMECCRSQYGALREKQVRWEKFSSMGNGFTFPLESLIFFAVAKSCQEYLHEREPVSVFGDDVILPKTSLKLFSIMMDFYGFQINWKKSHSDSPFRESCGAHYMSGVDVKPVFLKEHMSSVQSVFRLANNVRRLAHRFNICYGCDARFLALFDHLVQGVPKPYRFRIPEGYGDGGFISCFDEATPSRAKNGIEGYHYWHLAEVGRTYQEDRIGLLLSRLWPSNANSESQIAILEARERRTKPKATTASFLGYETKAKHNTVSLTGRTSVRCSKGLVQQWYDLGPWL